MFLINKSSIRHYNKSLTMKKNNKYSQNPKIQKSARGEGRSQFNHTFFSENFIYDPMNVFSKPVGAINNNIIGKN